MQCYPTLQGPLQIPVCFVANIVVLNNTQQKSYPRHEPKSVHIRVLSSRAAFKSDHLFWV